MAKARLLILNAIVFLLCSAMSKCHEAPGPVTTIHGFVTDAVTGQPFANVQMEVVSQYGYNFDSGNFVTTAADGSFYLKFTPPGTETFSLRPIQSQLMRYAADPNPFPKIVLGQDNDFNIKVFRFVLVDTHIINNSSQNRTDFFLDVNELNPKIEGYGTFFELTKPKADTSFTSYLPQMNSYSFKSDFFNGFSTTGLTDSVNFYKTIKLGVNDTTVVITNP
jgi:hypothetical protein